MIKKSKLIIAGSTVLAGSIITGIAVPLSQKANQPTPEQKQEQQVDPQKPNEPTPEQEQKQEEQKQDDSKKTEENSGQVETNKQQDDSQKASQPTPEQKQEQEQEQEQEKIPALTEEKQQNGAEAGSGEKTEENSTQAESTKPQVDSQKDSTKEEQQNGAESASGEDNKAAQPMKSQVDSQNNGNKNQQNNGEVDEKVEDSNTIKSSEQKIKELQSKLTPVKFYFKDKYFYLKLQTSKETFEKIKQARLKFVLEKGLREYVEQASEFGYGNQNVYYLNLKNESDGNVSFEISSDQRYGDKEEEKGTYKVTKVWLSSDPSETNLLDKNSDTAEVPSK